MKHLLEVDLSGMPYHMYMYMYVYINMYIHIQLYTHTPFWGVLKLWKALGNHPKWDWDATRAPF
jgi:hypothetical protein